MKDELLVMQTAKPSWKIRTDDWRIAPGKIT